MKTITSVKAIISTCVLSSVLLLTACSKGSDNTPAPTPVEPTVTTMAVTSITSVTAVFNGNVTNLGNQTITARGAVFAINANPTVADYFVGAAGGSGLGAYSTNVSPTLMPNTLYHVRAVIQTNGSTYTYGNDVTFTTLP
jgi:hypothetical protein